MVVTRFLPHQCISQRAVRTIRLKGGPLDPHAGVHTSVSKEIKSHVLIQGGGGMDPCSSSGSAHVECEYNRQCVFSTFFCLFFGLL